MTAGGHENIGRLDIAVDGNFKAARGIAQTLLQLAPNNLKVLLLAGRVEYLSGSMLQAENFLARALQVAPNEIGIRRLLVHEALEKAGIGGDLPVGPGAIVGLQVIQHGSRHSACRREPQYASAATPTDGCAIGVTSR